ncbi:MAG: T9SS type A sorting domain-containing protein [Bacteroidetes bacterium]|nr:T9SS type A sorting domain-containing protein [Bacteroidota bacterium]MCB9222472.1 T9SS type A sorting domain-containing protein [Ignavibacteria bacterium]
MSITGTEVSSVRLFDIGGKMIKTYAQSGELDVSSISAGTCIIQILSGEDKVALKRVVILRE